MKIWKSNGVWNVMTYRNYNVIYYKTTNLRDSTKDWGHRILRGTNDCEDVNMFFVYLNFIRELGLNGLTGIMFDDFQCMTLGG